MNNKPIVMRKPEPSPQPTWNPSTDPRNPRALASNDALAMTLGLTIAGLVVLAIVIVLTRPAIEQALIGVACLGALAVITYPVTYAWMLWRHTRRVVGSTWQDMIRVNVPPARGRRRAIPFRAGGQEQPPIDLFEGAEDIPVPDLDGWDLEKLIQFIRRAGEVGLQESAWRNWLTDPELRRVRQWLADKNAARKAGNARNSPWELAGSVEDLIDWAERLADD